MKSRTQPYKIIFFASLGTVIEWAEYIFYGYMAVRLSQYFFPSDNSTLNLIKTFGLFAAGYLMRPLGALIFGSLGDSVGRKNALMASMLLMGFATLGIGLLPHYETIGFWAPLLLLALRLVQGLAVSGEYNGAAIFVIEQSNRWPCFSGSFIPASAAVGMVIGGVASYIVSLDSMPEWAYRIPFLIGGVGCWVALWIRGNLEEPKAFLDTKKKIRQAPLKSLFAEYLPNFIRVASIGALTGVYVYIGNVYFVVFLTQYCGFALSKATLIAFCAQGVVALLIPIAGLVGDMSDPTKIYRKACLFAAIGMPVMYALSATGQTHWILVAILIYAVINACMSGTMMFLVQNEFPTELRYRGTALAWSIAVALFGGTAPMLAQLIQNLFKAPYACAFYVSFFGVLTWWVLGVKWPSQSRVVKQDYKPRLAN